MTRQPVVRPRIIRSPTAHLAARPQAKFILTRTSAAEEIVVVLASTLYTRILEFRPDLKKDAETAKDGKDVIELFKDTRKLYQEFRFTVAHSKTILGADYVVLKGYPGLRKIFTAAKYSETNSKIISYSIGRAGVRKALSEDGIVSLVFIDALDVVDYVIDDKETGVDLGTNVVDDSVKTILSAAAGVGAGLAAVALGAPVVVPLIAGFVVTYLVSKGLDYADEHWKIKQAIHGWVQATVDDARRVARYARKKAGLVGAKVDSSFQDSVHWINSQWQRLPEWDDWIKDLAI